VISPGAYTFGPANGRLTVRTGKTGVAAKAGHNLLIEACDWGATLDVGAADRPSSITVRVDTSNLRVLEGTGGMQELGEDDMASIAQTVNEEILKGAVVEFASSSVELREDSVHASGELELMGRRHPISFTLSLDPTGRLTGTTTIKQSDWGLKPYSTLFGTLKVADEVGIEVDANLGQGATADG
jgi:polyisoprenoid-binding protein YceI